MGVERQVSTCVCICMSCTSLLLVCSCAIYNSPSPPSPHTHACRVVWKVGSSLLDGWDWDGDALSKHEKSHDDSKIRPMKATLKQLLVHWNVQMEVPLEE